MMPVLSDAQLDAILRPIYYSRGGFHGVVGLHAKLPKGSASLARVRKWVTSRNVGRYTQAVPPPPVYARFSETTPNRIHQADLLFLPNDRGFKYALCVVDVASRFKAARPLRNKTAAGVARQLDDIYGGSTPLKWPTTMMVDDGAEFKGAVTALLQKHGVAIRRAQPGHHRSQAFVESFHRWLAQRLFRAQYQKELTTGKDNREWVAALPVVVADMNATKTRLTGIAPAEAIKMTRVPLLDRKVPGEVPLPVGTMVFIATNEEDPKDKGRRRATDPWWTHKPYPILRRVTEPGQPILYYTAFSKHGLTRSQLRPV